jgi:NADP-dependent 3-hydroxy acid dehydrogenase YdfG
MQVVFITGGSTGIGKATGVLLQSLGFYVVGTSRSPDRYANHPFSLLEMDLHDIASIQKAIKEVVSKYGCIDVVVNNAGKGIAGPIEETPLSEIQEVFETNFIGPVAVIQSVLPIMRKQQRGKIINITSIAGYAGLPFRGIYSATKSSLHMITESDVATNISQGRYHVPINEKSPYKAIYGSARREMDKHVADGVSAQSVATRIHQLILKDNLKPHYTVGPWLQRFSVYLKSYLPYMGYEFLLTKFYKL